MIGYSANICTTVVGFSGRIMDMETGLSMASLMDPTTKEESSITGVLYQYMIMLILMVSGMYHYIIQALAETFILIPVNGAVFRMEGLLSAVLKFMAQYIFIGFRICLPMFAVMLIVNAVLGILAKVAPQMNMFAVGIQIKVLVGLVVLFLTAGMLPSISEALYMETRRMIVAFVEAMM